MAEVQAELTREQRAKLQPLPPRLLIIGAGARGNAYAQAITESTSGSVVSIAEPIESKRALLGGKYIWPSGNRASDQEFESWQDFIKYERTRQDREEAGERVLPGFDGAFICTLDETHVEIITALIPLGIHIMSEKPLATSLDDCLTIYRALEPPSAMKPKILFAIGHVLRYSPHNILLRKLLWEDSVIGDLLSMEHTEPVGWWHFAHSYVRGNWRKESKTAPSLLTKCCHDIDLILWLLCRPSSDHQAHLPALISSMGSLSYFRQSRKPSKAGTATNCLSCLAEPECLYSAKKIYLEKQLALGNTGWPVAIVDPEIEDCFRTLGAPAAEAKLMKRLAEDYDATASQQAIDQRPWFGRCVYEASNDVCDDQMVTMMWNDTDPTMQSIGAKTASLHMVAFTEQQCARRGRIYGTHGEIEYDNTTIRVHQFATGKADLYCPPQAGGHGGGDAGLAQQFVKAIESVKNDKLEVSEAQKRYIGCSIEEVIQSHAIVFAAEEARRQERIVNWADWWAKELSPSTVEA